MGSLASETDIFNMALDLLEEEPILSDTDNRPAVKFMKRNYRFVRDAALELHPWKFALARAGLTADPAAPAFGWALAYALPDDCLRLLPLTVGGDPQGRELRHAVEDGFILCNEASPLLIRYVKRQENVARFSPLFVTVLASQLAARAAHKITGKQSYAERLLRDAAQNLLNAEIIDSTQGTPDDAWDDDMIEGRYR